ncbi:MAG: hypothetical protein LC796_16925, partial [Acidobacteria bacterium]|nr:hypothetical protein [Acidobacteriota bacterium]MCA1609763.1 hypothetical protein [Acidobacteriota bacterium]
RKRGRRTKIHRWRVMSLPEVIAGRRDPLMRSGQGSLSYRVARREAVTGILRVLRKTPTRVREEGLSGAA